jgi:hypothetical protein
MLCSLRAPETLTTTAGRRHLLHGSVDKESASSREPWDLIQMQGRLFGLMAVGKKEISQMDHKIGGAAVAGVLNLGNVLELGVVHIGAKLIQKSSTAQNNPVNS